MATRRLTDAFLLLRNNAVHNRHILAEQVSNDGGRAPDHGAVSLRVTRLECGVISAWRVEEREASVTANNNRPTPQGPPLRDPNNTD